LPRSVSVPATSLTLSPLKTNLLADELGLGLLAASKKSACSSGGRPGATPVLTEVMSMVISTLPDLAARSS
jgi:hypothetical protein